MDDPNVQKLKGKLQQAEGKVKKFEDNNVEGTIDEMEGKAEEQIAEFRIRVDNQKAKNREAEVRERMEYEREKDKAVDLDEEDDL